MVSRQQQIDSTIEVITPENIAFNYQAAGPFRRLPAFLVDFLVRLLVILLLAFLGMLISMMLAISIPLASFGSAVFMFSIGLLLLVYFVLEWFYGALFETYMNGQTPGKWLLGIRVVTVEGQPINGMQAMLRNLVRAVDMFPPVFLGSAFIPTGGLGLAAMTMNRRFQRLGDLVAGTMVVIEERTWLLGVSRLEDPRAAQLAAYLPPKFEVSRTLAQALAAYVERRGFFSPARRREIARHIGEPLLRQFELPADTSHDLLLCALYYKAFIAEHGDDTGPSPFSTAPAPGMPPPPRPTYVPPPLPQEQMAAVPQVGPPQVGPPQPGSPSNPFIIRR
ncbi:MAG: RDD family protein [Pirellulaceae bacterium]